MAALQLVICLAVASMTVLASPPEPLKYRNTIFGDERMKGEAFEFVDEVLPLSASSINPYRLPTTTRPQHYTVLWTVNPPNRVFSGTVDIDLYATQQNVNEIIIHAHDLSINSVVLTLNGVTVFTTYRLEPEYHFLRVALTSGSLAYNAQTPVLYKLSITFNAPLRTDMYGIYQSWFRNIHTENVRWMASTQFQATAARFAFPCYDEPSFKATFSVTIRRPTSYRSWFCTRLLSTTNSNVAGFQDDRFHDTPIMSTYLLALIVAEYESIRYPTTGLLMYEVIARPGAINAGQGVYSFEVGQELLAEMSNHTAMDFYSVHPNLKMTQAAIPDFGAGAMENWGLLTYREAYLMYDQQHTNSYFKQLIAYILSHEIAHMWFGNLVTCDWWDVLWLNEGFARYYQYFLTDWVEDYMGLGTRFITEQVHTSLLTDSADNPQPLTNPGVGSPASVSAMFSTISYNKGAAIIRMTEHLMGFNVHREGLRNFLRNRAFDTALPIHLFQALQDAAVAAGAISAYGSDFSIIDYYRTWTEQGGHPVLNVDVDHSTGQLTIYQRRFNINTGYSTAATNWIIPITFATASNPDFSNTKPSHILRDAITIINRTTVGDEWIIFNKQQTGYYRVNYDDYTWNLIVMLLRSPRRTLVHEYNRAQIVNDVFTFARSRIMSYNRAFNILSFLENETEYTPWVAAITGFNWINNRVIGTTLEAPLNAMFMRWASNVMNQLTYYPIPNESFMRSYLRYQLAPVMCRLGNTQCLAAATAQFTNLRTTGAEVPVDSRNWVYCSALRQGTVQDFEFLWQRFQQHNVYTEKIQILMVLGCTPHQTALNTLLNGIVQDNFIVRPQDYSTAFNAAVTGNEGNTQIVFQYIQNNLAAVENAFGSITTPLSAIASRLRTVQQVNEFRLWASNNQGVLGTSYQAIVNAANASLDSIAWAAEVQADISNYLVNGDLVLQTTTPAVVVPTTPSTVAPPALQQPVTPAIPDSANTAILSVFVLIAAALVNFLL